MTTLLSFDVDVPEVDVTLVSVAETSRLLLYFQLSIVIFLTLAVFAGVRRTSLSIVNEISLYDVLLKEPAPQVTLSAVPVDPIAYDLVTSLEVAVSGKSQFSESIVTEYVWAEAVTVNPETVTVLDTLLYEYVPVTDVVPAVKGDGVHVTELVTSSVPPLKVAVTVRPEALKDSPALYDVLVGAPE